MIRYDGRDTVCTTREGLPTPTRQFLTLNVINNVASAAARVKLLKMACGSFDLFLFTVDGRGRFSRRAVLELDPDCGMRASLSFTFQLLTDLPGYKGGPFPFEVSFSEKDGVKCQTSAPQQIATCTTDRGNVDLVLNGGRW